MQSTIEIVIFLLFLLLIFSVFGAVICGISYKNKHKPFYKGLLLGGFSGLLAGLMSLGLIFIVFFVL